MAPPSRGLELVRESIEVVLRRLAALPPSPEVVELRAKAVEHLRAADGWAASKPPVEAREKLMKRVLALHVEVAKLEREARR